MLNFKSFKKNDYIIYFLFFIFSLVLSYLIVIHSNVIVESLENKNDKISSTTDVKDFNINPKQTPNIEDLFIWRKISPCCVKNMTFYNNNLYAVGTNGQIYRTIGTGGDWVGFITKDTNVKFIKIFNNEIFAIEESGLLVKHKLDGIGKWSTVKSTDKKDIKITNFDIANNNIYAVGNDFKVYQKPIYDGSWRVFTPGSVKYIQIANNKIYGIGLDNRVYTYPISAAPVQNTPICILRNPDTGEIRCAGENQKCNFKGLARVTYRRSDNVNSDSQFKTMTARDGIMCNNATFGDPAPGHHKSCFYKSIPNIEVTCNGKPGFGNWGIGPEGAQQSNANCNHYSSTGGFSNCPIIFPSKWKNISNSSVHQILVVDNKIYGLGDRGRIWKLDISNGSWNRIINNGNMREILIVNHLIYGISKEDNSLYVHPLKKR